MELFHASPWAPVEWIKAHGAQPRGLWYADELNLGPTRASAGTCAFAQAVVRFAETHPERAVLLTTHCDQLRRGFDTLAGSLPGRAFLFNLPATWQSSVAERLYDSELERLSRFLLALGGHLPTPEALRQTIDAYAGARQTLLAHAEGCPAPAHAEAIARFHWEGPTEAPAPERGSGKTARFSETAQREAIESSQCPKTSGTSPSPGLRPPSPRFAGRGQGEGHLEVLTESRWELASAIPIALLGGPLPRAQWPLIEVIERAGARVALNGTETGERSLWTGTSPDVELAPGAASVASLRSWLARSYVRNCVDMFQRPNTRLYAWLKERLAARAIRGIVLWHYVGCDLWRAEAQSLREAFGLPLLLLDAGDAPLASARDNGRVEAFIESLR